MNLSIAQQYLGSFLFLINGIFVPLIFAIAFLTFVWGAYRYFILGADNEGERNKGKQFILWSIIGFVVILSVWGLVAMVGNTFGLAPGGTAPTYPTL